ncbi:MAG: hypothetical protein KGZ39_00625 [Simkania sp.]|nr:hypothetical protein [Simkania sp.]
MSYCHRIDARGDDWSRAYPSSFPFTQEIKPGSLNKGRGSGHNRLTEQQLPDVESSFEATAESLSKRISWGQRVIVHQETRSLEKALAEEAKIYQTQKQFYKMKIERIHRTLEQLQGAASSMSRVLSEIMGNVESRLEMLRREFTNITQAYQQSMQQLRGEIAAEKKLAARTVSILENHEQENMLGLGDRRDYVQWIKSEVQKVCGGILQITVAIKEEQNAQLEIRRNAETRMRALGRRYQAWNILWYGKLFDAKQKLTSIEAAHLTNSTQLQLAILDAEKGLAESQVETFS